VHNRYDRLGLAACILPLALLAFFITAGDLRWLLIAAIPCAFYAIWRGDRPRLLLACLTPPVYCLGFILARWALSFQHRRIDAALAAADIDGGLATGAWHWCIAHPWMFSILWPFYYMMGLAIMLGLFFTRRRLEMLRCLAIASAGAVCIYWLLPAAGPAFAGQPNAFPNGIPSMHMGFALICFLYAEGRLRRIFGGFIVLTIAATLGLGEHYTVDLVAAIPFVFACEWAAQRLGRRQPTTAALPSPSTSADFPGPQGPARTTPASAYSDCSTAR
jgi:hypothetical protein